MIFFLSDFQNYPTAIVDDKTTNESFLQMAAKLKAMDVKNYYFFLVLLQKDLQGVDPFSPDLTIEQKTMIRLECEFNPWYFFREIYRIPDGSHKLRYRLNRPLLALLWCFFNSIDFALIIPRQNGKSITCDGLEIWLKDFYYENTEMFLFTKNDELRKTNIGRIKKAEQILPIWLNPITKKDADNTEMLTCLARNNILRTAVGQQAEFHAANVGRGPTYPYFHTDEAPFIPNIHISLPVAIGSTTAARENCEANGTFYGSIYTTTAGKLDSKEGAYMHSFIYSGMYWNELLYDTVDKYDARETVIKNSTEDRCLVHGTFSHRQCGRTDLWLKKVISQVKRTIDEIARDFLNKWTSGTESSALSTQILEVITASEIEPKYIIVTVEKYIINWYIEKEEIHNKLLNDYHILGLDSSNAVGRDANSIVLTDITDMAIIATCRVSEANLHKYALWLADFLIRYPKITLVIEHKSSATGIIDTVSAKLVTVGIDPFTRMYNKVVENHKVNVEDYQDIMKPLVFRPEHVYLRFKKYFGFSTGKSSRAFLYDTVLNDAVKSTGHKVRDKGLSNELKGLIIKNGRVDHLQGGHDDTVIAWLLCHWFIKHSKNLYHYGINPLICLSLVSNDGATLTDEELENKHLVARLNNEINDLKTELISAPNLIEAARAEKMLAYKVKQVNSLGDITINMDQIMREVSNLKVSNRNLKHAIAVINANKIGLGTFNTRY